MQKIIYNGWLCGNDSYPAKIKEKYKDKINKEVFGFNRLAKKIDEVESNWNYIEEEYRVKEKVGGKSIARKPWDHYIKINNDDVLAEFDGYQHYKELDNYIKDQKYAEIAQRMGYKVVRIPFFIQLNNKLIEYYFGIQLSNITIDHTFPQGFRVNGKEKIPEFLNAEEAGVKNFVNTMKYKSILPTDFCIFGLERFQKEILDLSKNGFNKEVQQIKESIVCRAEDYGWDIKYAMSKNMKWDYQSN